MADNDFRQRILQEEQTLGKLTGQLLDGNSDAFVDTAADLVGTIVAGTPLGGVLAQKAVRKALSLSSWGRLNEEISHMKKDETDTLATEAQAIRLANHLAGHFEKALMLSARNLDVISAIVKGQGEEILNRIDELSVQFNALLPERTPAAIPAKASPLDESPLAELMKQWATVLHDEYAAASEESLIELARENGWLNDTADDDNIDSIHTGLAEMLVNSAFDSGPNGLLALAEAVRQDYPASEAVLHLYAQTRHLLADGACEANSGRDRQVRECIQYLNKDTCLGVALMKPFGFDARSVVTRVLDRLSTDDDRILPVHLVPRRGTHSEERLYKALFKDLERGLSLALKQPLYGDWRKILEQGTTESTADAFEDTLIELVQGPVDAENRVLLIVIEGLARVSDEHRQSWGYALARSSNVNRDAVQRLKILAWGGQALHDLRTRPPEAGFSSAFHHLHAIPLSPLTEADISSMAKEYGEISEKALSMLYDITDGHPALVRDCLHAGIAALNAMDEAALMQRLRQCVHMERLANALDGNPDAQNRLSLMARNRTAMRLDKNAEQTLKWLGIITESKTPDQWTWTTPVMKVLA